MLPLFASFVCLHQYLVLRVHRQSNFLNEQYAICCLMTRHIGRLVHQYTKLTDVTRDRHQVTYGSLRYFSHHTLKIVFLASVQKRYTPLTHHNIFRV